METGERHWALRWVVVHRDRIPEFDDGSGRRRSGLAVCAGRGLPASAAGLGLPGLRGAPRGPVAARPGPGGGAGAGGLGGLAGRAVRGAAEPSGGAGTAGTGSCRAGVLGRGRR